MNKTLLTSCLALAAFVGSASAAIVFTEDFQGTDVSGYSQGTQPASFVDAGSGFGAGRHGLIDEDSGAFTGQATAANDGEQGYAFRYTSSPEIATTEAALGWSIAEGDFFQLSFDAVEDLNDNGISVDNPDAGIGYDAYLYAVDRSTADPEDANSAGWTELANLTGAVTPGTTWESISFDYTVTSDDINVKGVGGQNLVITFKDLWVGNDGLGDSSAIIDNVSLDATAVPEPSSFALLAGCFGLAWVMVRRRG